MTKQQIIEQLNEVLSHLHNASYDNALDTLSDLKEEIQDSGCCCGKNCHQVI